MADKLRRAVAPISRTLALTAIVAGVAIGILRRSERRKQAEDAALDTSVQTVVQAARDQPVTATAAAASPEQPAPAPSYVSTLASVPTSSPLARVVAFMRPGVTPTVVVLAILGAVTAAAGFWLLPDTTVPQPVTSSVELHFDPEHPATSPIIVELWLSLGESSGPNRHSETVLHVDLKGPDLAHAGWSLFAIAPKGFHVLFDSSSRVDRYDASSDSVLITPGAVRGGAYSAALTWDNLEAGALQVRNANLAAAFPSFQVQNYSSGDGREPPQPQVSVSRHLRLTGDYAFVSGLPPDEIGIFLWSWRPVTGQVNQPLTAADAMTVVARSATEDQRSHTAEFRSGLAFGIAAAALLSAVQEFLTLTTPARRRGVGP
ncbi:hypothetical protein ACIBPB_30120 [Micromonospora sp. NPDC049836]|uniref:hypothetical protein n=1 Tax=Micromonospora sp. NPDC049836 TaxID=3364274 RepID=UPI003794A965